MLEKQYYTIVKYPLLLPHKMAENSGKSAILGNRKLHYYLLKSFLLFDLHCPLCCLSGASTEKRVDFKIPTTHKHFISETIFSTFSPAVHVFFL